MIDLEGFYLFIKVVEAGSFSAASRRIQVPTATISRRVAQLEEQLGYKLLHRSSRRLTLTDSGERYYRACQPLLNGMDEVTSELSNELSRPSGVLKVSAPVYMASNMLAPWICEFMDLYPEIRIETNLTNRPIDLIDESIDVAFRIGEIQLNSWISRPLGSSQLLMCASPEYITQHGAPHSPDDLASHHLIYCEPLRSWVLENSQGQQVRIQHQARLLADELNLAHRAMLHGLGIANLPSHMVKEDLKAQRLVQLMPRWRTPPRSMHMLYADRRHIPAKVRTFIDFITDKARANPLQS